VKDHFQIKTLAHSDDLGVLANTRNYASMFGITMDGDPASIDEVVAHDEVISFGNSQLRAIHVPGHSPGSLVFYSAADGFCIAGDVLFRQSIGRTDLPGGDHQTLISGIQERLMVLPPDTVVFPGHGPSTTIGFEKQNNPYL
nr:MBL fold metallo-hydrolase [Breznakibacter sp.]